MSGLRLFYFVLFGQTISVLGSSLTNFGVSVWILREYADSDLQTTLYSLTLLASTLPALLVGPFIGSLVDRWPRKLNLIGERLPWRRKNAAELRQHSDLLYPGGPERLTLVTCSGGNAAPFAQRIYVVAIPIP